MILPPTIIEADYASLELRTLAQMVDLETMRDDFKDRNTRVAMGLVFTHHPKRVPTDLPSDIEHVGPCVCVECLREAFACGRGVAWSGAGPASHSDEWRRLSWSCGDEAASWICGWCDRQKDPREALAAVLTVAEAEAAMPLGSSYPYGYGSHRWPSHDRTHPREKVYAYVRAMSKDLCR